MRKQTQYVRNADDSAAGMSDERGSAIVIALLIMVLLLGFVAMAVTRTTNETVASSNDTAETRTFEAAQASLETMTSNFDKIFQVKLAPESNDIKKVKNSKPPEFENYIFEQNIEKIEDAKQVVMTGEMFQGLNATRDKWRLETTATDSSGVQVALRREFFNNLIPIFQFGIFYNDDLEFHPGPKFDFGGRVHSNGHLFLSADTGLHFSSKVSAAKQVFTDVSRSGIPTSGKWGEKVFLKNADGVYVQIKRDMGSVLGLNTSGALLVNEPDAPKGYKNDSWSGFDKLFQGNLLIEQKRLDLPIFISAQQNKQFVDYVEIIKRGRAVGDLHNNGSSVTAVTETTKDDSIKAAERYYNKTGIRVSLADSKEKLPGCATGTGAATADPCGIRLDGDDLGGIDRNNNNAVISTEPGSSEGRGYLPRPMSDSYQATRLNGQRFYAGNFQSGREAWIKIETVQYDEANLKYVTYDITEDILSLGVTEQAPSAFNLESYGNSDSRSVIKLQRFSVDGSAIHSTDTNFMTSSSIGGVTRNYVLVAERNGYNYEARDDGLCKTLTSSHPNYYCYLSTYSDHLLNVRRGYINSKEVYLAPFPIKLFDTREGLYFEGTSTFNPTASSNYGSNNVPWAGVMSLVDIDVSNLRKYLNGDFDTAMPSNTVYHKKTGNRLTSDRIPQNKGWVLYVSDRRGDKDFDGEYDMEDVYGNNDDVLQPGEDVNGNGTLQSDVSSGGEAPKYTKDGAATDSSVNSHALKALTATVEHRFYRRGVRLIKGQLLPGYYNTATPSKTRGFTVASENNVYVLGNYNASHVATYGQPTPSSDYRPIDDVNHIPASIAADSITILSNNWDDTKSFLHPFTVTSRKAMETTVRFALISGDTRTSLDGSPNQGGGDQRMSGGVHNFKRFVEDWENIHLNYAGSLINLYNSRNGNGTFKCCSIVYKPPKRNWVFDMSFLDIDRLPPGTPYFQTLQLTGFQRLN